MIKVEDTFYIRVMFTTQSKIICRVEEGSEAFEEEIKTQLMSEKDEEKQVRT